MDLTWVIAWREVNSILRQRRMLLYAVAFGVVIPLLAGAGVVGVAARLSAVVGLSTVGHLHATLRVTQVPQMVQGLLVWLGIFPVMFGAQFTAIAFAAERERRSLPALLATPVPLDAIFCGKLLASLVPGYVTLLTAYGVFIVSATTVAPEAGAWLPPGTVLAAALFLVALSLLINGAALLISTRSHTVAGAASTVTFVSLPASVGTAVFAVVMGALGPLAVVDVALAIAAVAVLVLWVGTAHWKRGEILAS